MNGWGRLSVFPRPPIQSQASEGLAVAKSLQGDPGKVRGGTKAFLTRACAQSPFASWCVRRTGRREAAQPGAAGQPAGGVLPIALPGEQEKEAAQRNGDALSVASRCLFPRGGCIHSLVSISSLPPAPCKNACTMTASASKSPLICLGGRLLDVTRPVP